jgi:hypothetical protein
MVSTCNSVTTPTMGQIILDNAATTFNIITYKEKEVSKLRKL